MAARSVACTLINQTGEPLSLAVPPELDHGIITPGQAPPPSCEGSAVWSAESEGFMTGTEGRVTYRGPSGSVVLYWNNPFIGGNDYGATPAGDYFLVKLQGPKVGSNVSATYVVDRKNKPAPAPPPEAPAPAEEPAPAPAAPTTQIAERPEEIGRDSHVPKVDGQLTVISPKDWLVDIAWQAVNEVEWNPLILEITENRHGEESGAPCPGVLPAFPGVKVSGPCRIPHADRKKDRDTQKSLQAQEVARLEAEGMDRKTAQAQAKKTHPIKNNDFHSWCGDFVTWVFWKAWVLQGMPQDRVTKAELGTFLNREAINGVWQSGENLNMVEAYAKAAGQSGLLVWHHPGDGYVPQPGDIFMANRPSGGHIGIVASYEIQQSYGPTDRDRKSPFHWFLTIDGKSFDFQDPDSSDTDKGWLAEAVAHGVPLPPGAQGVAQNRRRTNATVDPLRGFVDTSRLRAALGYR